MLIQVLIIIFIIFALSRVILRYKDGAITVKELLLWLIFWASAAVAVLLPGTTSFFAGFLGVGRGVDLAIYIALIIIFYMMFRIFVRLEKIEQDITKVVREVGLGKVKEEKLNLK